jgi:hypothetical protein
MTGDRLIVSGRERRKKGEGPPPQRALSSSRCPNARRIAGDCARERARRDAKHKSHRTHLCGAQTTPSLLLCVVWKRRAGRESEEAALLFVRGLLMNN